MKRKIIKQAKQAYTITLPIEWIRDNPIKKGTEVDLLIKDKLIIINSKNKKVGKSIKVDYKDLGFKDIYRILGAAYA
jgi:phosphate uptake regulator